jgi:putative SOS response-associated peptidase YedK
MCGRFARYSLSRELERYFNAHPAVFEIQPNYNVAPTQEIPVIILQEGERRDQEAPLGVGAFLGQGHLHRFKDDQRPCGNRNLETCLQGCLQTTQVSLPSEEPFAFAGLWEVWESKDAPSEAGPYKSCTLITTDASEAVKDIHNRMPLILKPEFYEEWLNPENKQPARIEQIMKSGFVSDLKCYPVSKLVNQVGNK